MVQQKSSTTVSYNVSLPLLMNLALPEINYLLLSLTNSAQVTGCKILQCIAFLWELVLSLDL